MEVRTFPRKLYVLDTKITNSSLYRVLNASTNPRHGNSPTAMTGRVSHALVVSEQIGRQAQNVVILLIPRTGSTGAAHSYQQCDGGRMKDVDCTKDDATCRMHGCYCKP